MKTKIRTFIAICVLGFMGLININAIADEKKTTNADMISKDLEMGNNETVNNNLDFLVLEQEITDMDADAQIEKYANMQILLNANSIGKPGFIKAAESLTAEGADLEISRYVDQLTVVVNEKGSN